MLRLIQFLTVCVVLLPLGAAAYDTREIASITVLADNRLSIPLSMLASQYAQDNMVSVANVFGVSAEQVKKIEDGESADLFITATPDEIQQLKTKGMVDVYSIGRVASRREIHFTAAVVASENMTTARGFLKFLKSEPARAVFRKYGLTAP